MLQQMAIYMNAHSVKKKLNMPWK